MSEINSTQTELLDDKILANDIESELSNRFIAYALSTIISRSLPDIRDGLKPVHRRIMFAMKEMRLSADQRFRKAAAVVGNVIGKFHPHGDQAVYDAMVRLAQDFSLRYPLVEGQGNFGNIDGDSAAAMRYTEVKLTKLAGELLREIDQGTVTFKETYDQRATEPELLPARIPNLLINGTTGIAVGLATSFPPHNLGEIIDALLILVDNRNSTLADILKVVKGPDFPTYGEIVASKNELLDIYQTGKGGLKTHGQWHVEKGKKGRFNIIIDSIPYSVNKSRLIEKIADIIRSKRLTDIVDIRDESTDIVRILLEPRSATVNPNKVIAYLFKHSELQINYQLNLTALTKETVPKRHSLKEALIAFLDFRIETIIKRTQFRINKLTDRLKILEALVKIYNNIDKTIEIIKRSKTKDEARSKLISSFKLDEIQANAILDLRLASIVGLEIAKIQDEEKSAKNELKQLNLLINSKARLRKLVKNEFMQLKNEYGDKRRTVIKSTQKEEIEYDEDSYIVDEECEVIISKHGLAKRIKQLKDLSTLRFKEGDSLLSWLRLSSKDLLLLFTSIGKLYSLKVSDILQTTGFGDPVQNLFKFEDGERLISTKGIVTNGAKPKDNRSDLKTTSSNRIDNVVHGDLLAPTDLLLVILESGLGFRFKSELVASMTTRNGKKVANLKESDAVLSINKVSKSYLFILTKRGYILFYKIDEIPILAGAGKGVKLITLKEDDAILAARIVNIDDKLLILVKGGKDIKIDLRKVDISSRAKVGKKFVTGKKIAIGMTLIR